MDRFQYKITLDFKELLHQRRLGWMFFNIGLVGFINNQDTGEELCAMYEMIFKKGPRTYETLVTYYFATVSDLLWFIVTND